MSFVNRAAALKNPTHHQFIVGVGYLNHGCEPDVPASYPSSKTCHPASDAADGSSHWLKPSHNAPPMQLIWIASHKSWRTAHPGKGNRMAWTADYLARAGWSYQKPVETK
jgi:hypothetical protein